MSLGSFNTTISEAVHPFSSVTVTVYVPSIKLMGLSVVETVVPTSLSVSTS